MDKTFNPEEYVQSLAEELVENFANANRATTPQLVGSAKEKAVRMKLELLLPNFVGVGTGCIIDTSGQTSKQCDIVIYEKEFCPVFSINGNPETTYYPCESVIAIGEIKSSLNSEQLLDSFNKIKSVKSLKRHSTIPSASVIGGYEYRAYGSKLIITGVKEQEYNPIEKFNDQIYGFILTEDIPLKLDTFMTKYIELANETPDHLLPNLTMSINNGLFLYFNKKENQLFLTKKGADGIQNTKNPTGDFKYLLARLADIIYNGRTTNVIPFNEYIHPQSGTSLNGPYKDFK